jgi:hypothetical protein
MAEENSIAETTGLCSHCRHARVVESSKGSTFLFCELSKTDPRFAKYPRLPVLSCSGDQRRDADEKTAI